MKQPVQEGIPQTTPDHNTSHTEKQKTPEAVICGETEGSPRLCYYFYKGQSFTTYEAFHQLLTQYKRATITNIRSDNSKLLCTEIKRNISLKRIYSFIKPLNYYYIKFNCELGEKHTRTKCKKEEQSPPTHLRTDRNEIEVNTDKETPSNRKFSRSKKRIGCGFQLFLKYSDRRLVVQEVNDHDDHGDITFKKEKLPKDILNSFSHYKDERINIRRVINSHNSDEFKKISYKDIYQARKEVADKYLNIKLQKYMIYKLQGVLKEVLNENGDFLGVYFQNNYMKQCFEKYGEVIFMDGTYNLMNTDQTLFVISVVGAEGNTEPVCIFSCINECYDTIQHFLSLLVKNNDRYKPKIAYTDKDMLERKIINEFFPNCIPRLCLFHVLRCFYGQIPVRIKSADKNYKKKQKAIVRNIIFAKNEKDFTEKLNLLHINLREYFDKNWMKYKNEFIEIFYIDGIDFETRTNNRAEGFNSGLKKYFKKKRKYEVLFVELIQYLESLRFDRNYLFIKKYSQDIQIAELDLHLRYIAFHVTEFAYEIRIKNNCIGNESLENCIKLKRYGILCISCMLNNRLTIENFMSLCENRWFKENYVEIIEFDGMSLTKQNYIKQRNFVFIKNFGDLDIRFDNKNDYTKPQNIENFLDCKKTLSTIKSSKKSESNSILILTKQLGYFIKNDKRKKNNEKRKFIIELMQRCKDGKYNFDADK